MSADHPERNVFEVTEEYYCHNGKYGTREDVVFLINGIPVLVVECWLGRITEDKTIPQIRRFVESGGVVVTVGSSTSMAELLGVPLSNALAAQPRSLL